MATISLQSKLNYQIIHDRREKMIQQEHLHIKDSVDYKMICELYQKYAPELTEEEFVLYFLDIDHTRYYDIKMGYKEKTIILKNEFYSDEDLDRIEERLKKYSEIKYGDPINYDTLVSLWHAYGDRLSLKFFAYEILNIADEEVDRLKSMGNKRRISHQESEITRREISVLREKVINECTNLHNGCKINLEEFKEIYNSYKDCGLNETEFATRVLLIPKYSFRKLLSGVNVSQVNVFEGYPVDPEYISELREKVILNEKLKFGTITVKKFWDLYNKYGRMFEPSVFGKEILDAPWERVKVSMQREQKVTILAGIEIPEEHIKELRNQVMQMGYSYNEMLTIRSMRALFYEFAKKDTACQLLGEKQFIVKVLGVQAHNYERLYSGVGEKTRIFTDEADVDLNRIRKKMIKEEKLHYDDMIDYAKLCKLHTKYAPSVREYIFATQVLDICDTGLDHLRRDRTRKTVHTHILLDEPLPSSEELKELKWDVIRKRKLHIRDKFDYKKFKRFYNKYAGVMPEDMFAKQILDINKKMLTKIKNNEGETTQILLETTLTPEEVQNIRQRVLLKYKLTVGSELTVGEFNKIYDKEGSILTKSFFAKHVLGLTQVSLSSLEDENPDAVLRIPLKKKTKFDSLNGEDVDVLKKYLIQDVSYLQIAVVFDISLEGLEKKLNELYEKNIISLEEIQRKKIIRLFNLKNSPTKIARQLGLELSDVKDVINNAPSEEISEEVMESITDENKKSGFISKTKVKSILGEFLTDPASIKTVEDFLTQNRKKIAKSGICSREMLELLRECVEFAQSSATNIIFVARLYISYKDYSSAKKVITDNMDNSKVSAEDYKKLRELSLYIDKEIKKLNAKKVLYKGETDTVKIAKKFGLPEIDVIALLRETRDNSEEKPQGSKGQEPYD